MQILRKLLTQRSIEPLIVKLGRENMKRLLLWIFTLLLVENVWQACYAQERDSLLDLLNSYSIADTNRLPALYKLIIKNDVNKYCPQYARQLIQESQQQRNKYYEGTAYYSLVKYYYARSTDSMRYWMDLALPLFYESKRFEDFFRMKAWYIYRLTTIHENKAALDSVNSLKELALRMNYPEGADMANQALADYFIANNLKEEGTALYEEVLAGMEGRNAPWVKRVNIIRQLLDKSPTAEQRMKYLKRLEEYVNLMYERKMTELDRETPVYLLDFLVNRTYAYENTRNGKLNHVLSYLNKSREMIREYKDLGSESQLYLIYALYYEKTEQFEKSVTVLDSLLADYERKGATTYMPGVISSKANVLLKAGRNYEAALAFKEYAIRNDSLSKAVFYKDLAEMKTQHEVDKLELKTKQMELESLQSHSDFLLVAVGAGVLALICCMLGFLAYSRHKYGLQLKAAKEKAEESDRLKSAFLANMNHEIRTPLNAIVGFSQVLIDEEDKETRKQFAGIIQSNNELLQRLITDVLDISKIESNTMSLNYGDHDLPGLMNEIYNVILLRMHEGVELRLKTCLPYVLHTDRNRLTQILTNLLTNAIKHTQSGSISFGYELMETEVRFFVQDTGEGIPPEQQERIFSRFVQLDDWSKGVGLGLAICKGLLEKMRGSISVTSKPGEGSVFYVTLPLNHID